MGTIKCPECFNSVVQGQDMCFKCGAKLPKDLAETNKPNYSIFSSVDKYKNSNNSKPRNNNLNPNFSGIYRYDRKGNKKSEVICPRCKSWDCGFYQQEQAKAQYKANLNPFKPFTYVNKKEVTEVLERYICNKCGKIFD